MKWSLENVDEAKSSEQKENWYQQLHAPPPAHKQGSEENGECVIVSRRTGSGRRLIHLSLITAPLFTAGFYLFCVLNPRRAKALR